MARLPNPGSDHGQWGDILNDYLGQSLDSSGGIKPAVVGAAQLQDGSVTVSKLSASGPVNGQVLAYNGSGLSWTTVSGGTVPDADSSTKGLVQLTGALGGTASSPTVPGLAAKENTITAGTTGQYWRGDKSWQTLDKTAVGLPNADNTSDANKPVSTATQTALNGKASTATTVTGITSLTGGGDLSTNRTLSLVNDSASPGNDRYYGTNGSGTKGYFALPTGGTVPDANASTKGILQLTGDLGGTAASPTVPGLAGKEATITAGTTGQYYRGDKSWQTLDKTAVGLSNVDNTSDATKNSASVTLTNKTISGGSNTITGIAQSSVTNLITDLAGKASSTHNHAASDINSGTVATARLGSGTASASTVLLGDQTWGLAPLVSINAQSGTTYTLVLADAGKLITLTNGSAINMTVPTNASVAFPVGSSIKLAQMGSGQVTVVAAGGVSVFADPGLKIAAQYGAAELIKTATDTWLLVGRLAA